MSIGSKIKAIRKKRGMTQKELSDGIISRGMLSLIEGENATPSIQSLFALADRLEIPPALLLEEGDDINPAEQIRITNAVEKEFYEKNYQACLDILTFYSLAEDKRFSALFVSCAFDIALDAFFSGDFAKAKKLLEQADSSLSTLMLPLTNATPKRIVFLRTVMNNIDDLNNAICSSTEIPDFDFAPSLFFSLLKLISDDRVDTCRTLLEFCKFDSCYTAYINAQILIKDYKFIDAILLMKSIISKNDCPVFLKLLAYSTTENCCKLCEDYKGAYENHLAYQAVLDSIIR